jgi:hypothetical protein
MPVGERSTPSGTSSGTGPSPGATTRPTQGRVSATRPTLPTVPQRPEGKRPVGKTTSITAITTGSSEVRRSRNHSANVIAGKASVGDRPTRT